MTSNDEATVKLQALYTFIKCPNCNGYGSHSYGRIQCPSCLGKGVLKVEAKEVKQ